MAIPAIKIGECISEPGSPTRPTEDAYSFELNPDNGMLYAAVIDGATSVDGHLYETTPGRFYAQLSTDIVRHFFNKHTPLKKTAEHLIKAMNINSRLAGYTSDTQPRWKNPAAAGTLARISLDARSAEFYTLSDTSIIVQYPDGQITSYTGTQDKSKQTEAFHKEYGTAPSDPDALKAWKRTRSCYMRDGRNTKDGYKAFSIEPEVAPLGEHWHVALPEGTTKIWMCTDGMMRSVNDYKIWDMPTLVGKFNTQGTEQTARELHRLEEDGIKGNEYSKKSDDIVIFSTEITI